MTLPKFKLRWLRDDQERKDQVKARLLAECRKQALEQEQQPGTSQPTPQQSTASAKEDDFFSFSEDEECTVESEIRDYLKSVGIEINTLDKFPLIKNISLRYNAATPSSAPVERLFSLGSLILSPKRNRLSDKRFERLLLMRYNHWFEG